MDVALFFLLSVPPTLLATASAPGACAALALAVGGVSFRYQPAKKASSLDLFKGVKIVSVIAGVVMVLAAQLGFGHSDALVLAVLAVNVLEAVLADLVLGSPLNALCGACLVAELLALPLPVGVRGSTVLYPLPARWLALYTSWNAAFAYGVGFSRGARLVLLVPFIVCALLGDLDAWFNARTYSLIFLQVMRGTHFTRVFTPGESAVTKPEGAPSVTPALRELWGVFNCLIACAL